MRTIHFIVEDAGHRTATVVVPRPSTSFTANPDVYLRSVRVLDGRTLENPQYQTGFFTGKVNTELNFRTRFQLFDPDDPARYQLYADFSAEYSINAHWAIRSTLALNIENNFDESNRQVSDSVLPKVRSDVVRYLNEGESGLEKLIIEGRDTLGRSLHYRGFGCLEECTRVRAVRSFIGLPISIGLGASIAYASSGTMTEAWGFWITT